VAKPIVDGLEKQLTGKAKVIRLDAASQVGQQAIARYGVRGVPTLIVVNGQGEPVDTQVGFINSSQALQQVEALVQNQSTGVR
jgi:thioredoxin-like negative regulator of GroEL